MILDLWVSLLQELSLFSSIFETEGKIDKYYYTLNTPNCKKSVARGAFP